MGFSYHIIGDRPRPYSALFSFSTLFFSPYSGVILMNTVSSKSVCTNVFTTLNCSVSRSNLATSASRKRNEIIAGVVALVGKSWRFCWLPYTTNMALHFWSRLWLSVLYLKTHWHFSIWWPLALALLTDSQVLNCCPFCCIWVFLSAQNRSSNGWPLSSSWLIGYGDKSRLWTILEPAVKAF